MKSVSCFVKPARFWYVIKKCNFRSTGEAMLYKRLGKKVCSNDTASYCGYTGQYAELQKLYERFKDKLEIVGMPCNQFMMQEPGSNEKIAAFCKKNYGVSFTMLVKADVEKKSTSSANGLYSKARMVFWTQQLVGTLTNFYWMKRGK